MATWVVCTIGPADPDRVHELREDLLESVPEELAEGVRSPHAGIPDLTYDEEWEVLSADFVPATESTTDEVRQAVRGWIRRRASAIDTAYIVCVNNTSNHVDIGVYGSEDDQLGLVETVEGLLKVHPLRHGNGDSFPESALIVYDQGSGSATADPPIDRIDNILEEMSDEFGFRPMLHYS